MIDRDSLLRLREGEPPQEPELLAELALEKEQLYDFYCTQYLDQYIPLGGSKVKLLIGSEGCGKSHFLNFLAVTAKKKNYCVARIDARVAKLQRFDSLYSSIVDSVDLKDLASRYCSFTIKRVGYSPEPKLPQGMKFVNWMGSQGRILEVAKREVRQEIEKLLHNRRIDSTFAVAFMQLCGAQLGATSLDTQSRELILEWMAGNKILLKELRPLHIFTRIDKYNARNMLRSIIEITRLIGASGLIVLIDNLDDILANDSLTGRQKYSRSARDDAYEDLRELIDDIDNLERVMFVMAGRPELVDDDMKGLRSYDALWMRLQNEIKSDKPNKFADLLFLDTIMRPNKSLLIDLGIKLMNLCANDNVHELPNVKLEEIAEEVLSKSSSVSSIRPFVKTVMRSVMCQ